MSNTTPKNEKTAALYQSRGRAPIGMAIPFALQHILAMLVSNVTPIIIVAGVCGIGGGDLSKLIQSALLAAGIGTLIQAFPLWRIGSGLPVVMGTSFTFVSAFCYIGINYGFGTILGAALVGGIVEGVLGLLAAWWMRIITPVVRAAVVTAIGFSLLPVGAKSFGGGAGASDFGSWQNWVVGGATLLICLLFHAFGKGMLKTLSTLIGLAAGYILAACLGMVDFAAVLDSKIVGLPAFLSYDYQFDIGAILSVVCIYLVSASEVVGNCSALTESGLGREATMKEAGGAVSCGGFASSLASVFGGLPVTAYAQNVGLVAMTKVVNRTVLAIGAGILILAGFFPILGSLFMSVPQPVLGGCTIMMFGMIIVSGIEMIGKAGLSQRNITILSLSLGIGLGFTQVPQLFDIFPDIIRTVFAENCVALIFILSILLDRILPKEQKEK